MLMPKKNKLQIYEHLFKDGVLVARKDYHAPNHPEMESIPNIQVIKTLQSLKSRGYVTERFCWNHYYWFLTNEGIEYLRTFLRLPPEIVPSTLKRQVRETPRPRSATGQISRGADDRMNYRRAESDKASTAGIGFGEMEFRGGFGRGKGGQF